MNKVFLFFCPLIIWTQSGAELAIMLDQKPYPKNLKNHLEMILINSKGKSRVNRMISKSMDKNNKQMIWFLYPKDDEGVAFLKIEHKAKDDEMRMWLPAFKKVRRISAKKRGDSFMGSDLSFEDLSNRDLSGNNFNRLENQSVGEKECYVLETIPKIELKSSYSKHISYIEKNTLNIVKELSFDKRGELKKEKYFSYVRLDNYQILKRVFVKDIMMQHTTEILFSKISVDQNIQEDLFHEKNLKRIPRD